MPVLTLIFTKGVSLNDWKKAGVLSKQCLQYQKLADCGWEINFITYGDESDLIIANEIAPIKVLSNVWGLPLEIYQKNIPSLYGKKILNSDVIKIHQIDGGEVGLRCAEIWDKPLLVRCGYLASYTGKERVKVGRISNSELESIKETEKELFNFASDVIVTTEAIKNHIMQAYEIADGKVKVIPNSVDTNLFTPGSHKIVRDSIIYIGRLSPEKNIGNLIIACHELGLKLEIVGTGSDRYKLEELVLSLKSDTVFHGTVLNERLPDYLRGSNLFALVSFYEGNPKSLLEAMSCEIPVLGSNVKGINEIIEDGKNGVLCGLDIESIKNGLRRILADPMFANKIARNARIDVVEKNSLNKVFGREKKVLDSIVQNHPNNKIQSIKKWKYYFLGFYFREIYSKMSKIIRKISELKYA